MDKGIIVMAIVCTIFVVALWQGQEASIRNSEVTKERCITSGYYNKDRLLLMESEKNQYHAELRASEEIIAKNLFEYDKNYSRFSRVIETVFHAEKLYRDYNIFNKDLNVCKRFC